MHELSIACDLVEIAEAAARTAHAEGVAVVNLKLGVFAGVVKEALLFGYDIATKGTLLEGSLLKIEDLPLVIYCSTCNQESQLPSIQFFECPVCGNPVTEIRGGKELELTSMEIIEHAYQTA
ncbi:MAG: hydrogenase maturation nickel metallochaperone HypA [Anaerolineae bacterium]|nr:hydrogenase maturation nickel metallochaperone HypA [Anaerolineae bacterium]